MSHSVSWMCVWCGNKYFTLLGSKFAYFKEGNHFYKRRKCPACLEKKK
jgi:hypothetical protein